MRVCCLTRSCHCLAPIARYRSSRRRPGRFGTARPLGANELVTAMVSNSCTHWGIPAMDHCEKPEGQSAALLVEATTPPGSAAATTVSEPAAALTGAANSEPIEMPAAEQPAAEISVLRADNLVKPPT